MPGEMIKQMELKIWNYLEEHFPKGKHKDRGHVMVLIAMAMNCGVQGHADNIRQGIRKRSYKTGGEK